MLVHQPAAFGFFVFISGNGFIAGNQIQGLGAAFFRRQAVAGTAQEHPGGAGTDLHIAATCRAGNVGVHRVIRAHALFAFGGIEFLLKVPVETVQYVGPVGIPFGNMVELFFHIGGKAKIHQVAEVFHQPAGDDIAHFFGIKTPAFEADIATLLNGGNNGGVGRRPADAAFFQFFHQGRFGEAR